MVRKWLLLLVVVVWCVCVCMCVNSLSRLIFRPTDSPQRLSCPDKKNPGLSSTLTPPQPALSFPAECQAGGPSPPASSASCHSFLVKNKADAYQLAGDNVKINDKICKAHSTVLERRGEEECCGCVIFPKSRSLHVIPCPHLPPPPHHQRSYFDSGT